MNKTGGFELMLLFFIGVALLICLGLFIAFGGVVVDMFFDEFVPEIKDIGSVGSSNVTEYAEYGLDPVDSVVQSFSWMGGVIYFLGIIGFFALAFASKITMSKWLMGFFFAFAFLFLIASIFISNIYEDFYNDDDDIGSRLREQTLLSWLILQSPLVFTVVIFISGIIMFTGLQQEGFV